MKHLTSPRRGAVVPLFVLGLGVAAACAPVAETQRAVTERDLAAAQAALARQANPPDPLFFQGNVGDTVFFATDSSALLPAARATLDRQAEWLKVNPGFSAVAEGYADRRGPRGFNHPLAARRATAVRGYLIARGVSPTQIVEGVTFGEEQPRLDCAEESCLEANRRVVTVLTSADNL